MSLSASHSHWGRLEETVNPDWFLRFLDASRAELVKVVATDPKAYYQALDPQTGDRILDVGCGTGVLLHDLARLVQPDGEVVGIDFSQLMIDQAKERVASLNLPLTFLQADATNLPFEDASFDKISSQYVLQHIPNPQAALDEMVRVLKPGGTVMISDVDWDSQAVSWGDSKLSRRILDHFTDTIASGNIGRQLFGMMTACGLIDVRPDPRAIPIHGELPEYYFEMLGDYAKTAACDGIVTPREAEAWIAEAKDLAAKGEFYSVYISTTVSGKKPK